MGHQCSALCIEIRLPARCGIHVLVDRCGHRVSGVHLATQGFEFRRRNIRGAALYLCRFARSRIGRCKRRRAFLGQARAAEDIGGGVQVALAVPANQNLVFCESDIALHNAGAHDHRRLIGFARMFRELQRRTAMPNGHFSTPEGVLAARLQPLLQRPRIHITDQIEGPRANLCQGRLPGIRHGAVAACQGRQHGGNNFSQTHVVPSGAGVSGSLPVLTALFGHTAVHGAGRERRFPGDQPDWGRKGDRPICLRVSNAQKIIGLPRPDAQGGRHVGACD